MRQAGQWFVYFVALPWNLTVAWPIVLMVRILWGKGLKWETPPDSGGPVLTCELRADSWPARTWYVQGTRSDGSTYTWGGTTIGHGIFYGVDIRQDGAWGKIQKHEHVHVEQFEGHSLAAFVIATIVMIVMIAGGAWLVGATTALAVWWLGSYLVPFGANWSVAALRGENFYLGSSHEESAYSQAEEH